MDEQEARLEIQVAVIRNDINYIKNEIEAIKSWGRWAAGTVGATLLLNLVELVIKSGIAH